MHSGGFGLLGGPDKCQMGLSGVCSSFSLLWIPRFDQSVIPDWFTTLLQLSIRSSVSRRVGVLLSPDSEAACTTRRDYTQGEEEKQEDPTFASSHAPFLLFSDSEVKQQGAVGGGKSQVTTPVTTPVSTPAKGGSSGGVSTSSSGQTWCVANAKAGDKRLQAALDYACGEGAADCGKIQPDGPCYNPNTMEAHASYAFNSYYQKKSRGMGTCDFQGTAYVVTQPPRFGKCEIPREEKADKRAYGRRW